MTIVIEENGVILGLLAEGLTETTQVFERRVKNRLVGDLETEAFKLALEVGTDGLECLVGWHRMRVNPTLQNCTWVGLYDIWGIDVNVETQHERRVGGLQFSWG